MTPLAPNSENNTFVESRWLEASSLRSLTLERRRLAWLMEVRDLAAPRPVDKWHACPGSYNKFINFATNRMHAQPRRTGSIKDECVGRAMVGVEVIALGDGTLVDR